MTLTYKGIKINYNEVGKGPAFVFLHGFLENSTMWNDLIDELSTSFKCITIDLPGHGKTGNLGYIHTIEDMADTVHVVLQKLKAEKTLIIGHSMGGYVALAYAEKYPEKLSSLILLNSTSQADNDERKLNRTRAIKVVKQNPSAYTSMAIANLFAKENREKFKKEILFVKEQASKTSLQGIIAAQEGMKIRKDRRHILTDFKGKKIIIAGKNDPILSIESLSNESILCNTPFIKMSGGHMLHIENYADVLEIISNANFF